MRVLAVVNEPKSGHLSRTGVTYFGFDGCTGWTVKS